MSKDCIQLEMNFNGAEGNLFRERLDNGEFQILAELEAPSSDTRPADAAARFADFELLMLAQKNPCGALAFRDVGVNGGALDQVAFAAELCRSSRDAHLIYLSGRDRTLRQLYELAGHAVSQSFKSFCVVSGEPVPGEGDRETRARFFTESVPALNHLREKLGGSALLGAAVNPFKYEPCAAYNQAFKLMKKVNYGASFAVAQYGWDPMKWQEIRWNLFRRSQSLPMLARLLFLTPERAEAICSGHVPGVRLSPDFEIMLRREMQFSRAQFESAQLRRIQIHAAGARLLGYSGIQLAGIEQVSLLEEVLKRIRASFEEMPTFAAWLTVYQEYYARMDMAPYPDRFYVFEDLLAGAVPPEEFRLKKTGVRPLTRGERIRRNVSEFLFRHADTLPAAERHLTKKLLVSCRTCRNCRLPQMEYLCPERCPKGMANGPCGEVAVDGRCPFEPENECLFAERFRIAEEKSDFLALEETYVDPSDRSGALD